MPHSGAGGPAAKAPAAGGRTRFWLWWIGATTLGYTAGMGLAELLYRNTSTTLSGLAAGVGYVALAGALVGGLSGTLQALLLRGRIARPYLWALVSLAGGVAGFILGAAAGEAFSNAIGLRLDVYIAGALIQVIFGAVSGVAIGLAQGLLIGGSPRNIGLWVFATTLGLIFGFSIPLGLMQLISLTFLSVWFGVVGGLLLGLTQWLWARRVAW